MSMQNRHTIRGPQASRLGIWATVISLAASAALVVNASPAYATGSSYYVDCSAPTNGNGASTASPWNSLAFVDSHSGGFSGGDNIYFKRNTTCVGALAPHGSGVAGASVTIDAYGTGSLPIIDGSYASQAAVSLTDQSYWTIQNIEVEHGLKWGVHVTVTTGVQTGITLQNLVVHDVSGGSIDRGSGLVSVSPTTDSSNSTSARFSNVLVNNVTAYNTTMWAGILVGAAVNADGWGTDQSKRSTNVTIENSTVHDVYGDGITIFQTNTGLIQNSVAHDIGQITNTATGTPNGIWTWGCKDCTVQSNEVYNANSPGVDGGAFDIDYFNDNNTVQYNYGHDNSAYCVAVFGSGNYTTTNSTVRYNVCSNNGLHSSTQKQDFEIATWNGGGINGVQIYNNTVLNSHGAFHASFEAGSPGLSGSMPRLFENNIVDATATNPMGVNPGFTSDYNDWYTSTGNWENGEAHSLYADPNLSNASFHSNGPLTSAIAPSSYSPTIDAGANVGSMGSRDALGNAIPNGAYDIGAVETASTSTWRNFNFEAGSLTGWSNGAGAAIDSSNTHAGSYCGRLSGSGDGIYRTLFGLKPNTTYTFSGWLKSGSSADKGYLYAIQYGGTDVLSPTWNSTSYGLSSVTFTTGATSTSAIVGLWRDPGSGTGDVYFDDARVTESWLTNPGFDVGSIANWSNGTGAGVNSTSPHFGPYAAKLTGSGDGIYRTVSGLAPNTTYTFSAWLEAASSGQKGYIYAIQYGGADQVSNQVTSLTYNQVSVTFTTGSTNTSVIIGMWRDAGSGTGDMLMDDTALVRW